MILALLTGPAWARRDVSTAIEGDPGDGNLSPSECAAARSPGLLLDGDAAAKDADLESGTSTRVFFWVLPIPGVFPGGGLQPFWMTGSALDALHLGMRWERGSGHVR